MTTLSRTAPARWFLIGVVLLPLLSGCGTPKFYPVKGLALLHGAGMLTEGEVRFRPVGRPDLVATGRIQKDGTFSLTTPQQGEGVLEGTCKVAIVVEPRNGKPVIDARYADYDTSDLQFTVTAREENYFLIEVKRPGK